VDGLKDLRQEKGAALFLGGYTLKTKKKNAAFIVRCSKGRKSNAAKS
jgi:hypothetical protein